MEILKKIIIKITCGISCTNKQLSIIIIKWFSRKPRANDENKGLCFKYIDKFLNFHKKYNFKKKML